MRDEARLHVVAIASLTIAFFCLGAVLALTNNLARVSERWGQTARMTIYLRDGASTQDVTQLRMALEGVSGIASVTYVSADAARAEFLADSAGSADLAAIPADAFPASLELALAEEGSVNAGRIAERVGTFSIVEDVETYQGWFRRLQALVDAGHGLATGMSILVLLAVLLIVGSTIRLAVTGRREEIEVMKLCGASDSFVRGPFIVEGAVQGFAAALIAMTTLLALYLGLHERIDAVLGTLAGVHVAFVSPLVAVSVLLLGGALGAVGSAVSLRRYLSV
jgi:cell division transport system permease protein